MIYLKSNPDKENPKKYWVAYYDGDGKWRQVSFMVDESIPFEEWRARIIRATLAILGENVVEDHRLIHHQYPNGGTPIDYWLYLTPEQEAQVVAGQVTDQQVAQLFTQETA